MIREVDTFFQSIYLTDHSLIYTFFIYLAAEFRSASARTCCHIHLKGKAPVKLLRIYIIPLLTGKMDLCQKSGHYLKRIKQISSETVQQNESVTSIREHREFACDCKKTQYIETTRLWLVVWS